MTIGKWMRQDTRMDQIVTKEEAEAKPIEECGGASRIVVRDQEEKERALDRVYHSHVCGECQHFDLRMGQEELKNGRTFMQLFNELEHNPQWYGNLDMFGFCHQWDGHMCHAMAPATIPCQFVNSDTPYIEQDRPVECPVYKRREKGFGSRAHYVGKRRNYEQ